MSGTTENDLEMMIKGGREHVNLAFDGFKSAPVPSWLMALAMIIRALELMFARLAKVEDRLLGLAPAVESKATEHADAVTPGQTAYEAWRELPHTKSMFAHTKQWHQLPASDADEWEAIAAAVVDKHGREQVLTNAGTFDDGLVERLADAYERGTERGAKPTTDGIVAVLAELANAQLEISVEDIAFNGWGRGKDGETVGASSRRLHRFIVNRIAPILAAKDDAIASLKSVVESNSDFADDMIGFEQEVFELLGIETRLVGENEDVTDETMQEARDQVAVRIRDMQARITELEKLVNVNGLGDGMGVRNIWFAHLQRANNWQDCDATREIFDASFGAGARAAVDVRDDRLNNQAATIADLEKRHAELLAAAQVALEHWGSDDAEHEAAAMTELQRLVDEVA